MRRPTQHDVASGGNLRGSGGDGVASVRKKAALQAKEGAADAVRPRPSPGPSSGEQVAAASGPAPSTPSSPPQIVPLLRADSSAPAGEPPAARTRRDSSAV